ncbi:MAG: hypothetical protein RI959_779 [Pseudomonadota bacterium]|jgi:SAM-dependent methyltransferase
MPRATTTPTLEAGDQAGNELLAWFHTPPGQYLLEQERSWFDHTVADLFGFHALQLGLPVIDALAQNRMPHRWLVMPHWSGPETPTGGMLQVALVTHAAALPFPASSIDLVVLPHTLELSADPHAVLREVERVLVPEGKVVISGLNPASWWGLRQQRSRLLGNIGLQGTALGRFYLPQAGDFIGHWRLRDWLRLLSFDVESVQFGCYRPPVTTPLWLNRWSWLDALGPRVWPVLGAVYCMVGVKRVRGMRLLGPAWQPQRAVSVPAAVAQKHTQHKAHH